LLNGLPPRSITRVAQQKQDRIASNEKKKKEEDIQSIKVNIKFNVVSPIKQIVCVHEKRGETLLNFEYNKKHLHFSLRRLQALRWSPITVNPYG